MGTSYPLPARLLDGVRRIVRLLSGRLWRKKKELNFIVAKLGEKSFREGTSKWITSNPSFQLGQYGTDHGMVTGYAYLSPPTNCKFSAKNVTKRKQVKKTKGDVYAGASRRRKVPRARPKA